MLQRARSVESTSLLREAKDALVLIEDDNIRKYFLHKIANIVENRANPDISHTGAIETKREILSYLKQQGEISTANIWARNLRIDLESIANLKAILGSKLLESKIFGILEIHLQDREINSPHIQFVGTNAKEAESIIAQVLVSLKYEISLESAIGRKDFAPAYEYIDSPITKDLEYEIKQNEALKRADEIRQKAKEKEFNLESYLSQMKQDNRAMLDSLDSIFDNLHKKIANRGLKSTTNRQYKHRRARNRLRVLRSELY